MRASRGHATIVTVAVLVLLALSASTASAAIVYEPDFALTPSVPFNGLLGIAVDNSTNPADPSAGDVYVASAGPGAEFVAKFSATGTYISSISSATGAPSGFDPEAVAVDPANGDVYVASYNPSTLTKFDPTGALIASFHVSGVSFSLQLTGERVAVDPTSGDVYVADSAEGVVDKLNSTGALIPGSITDPNLPRGVAVDTSGNVYVSDSTGVQEYSSTGSPIGSPITTGESYGVAADPPASTGPVTGGVYVNTVSMVDVYSGNCLVSQFGLSGNGGIAVTSSGELYVDTESSVEAFRPVLLADVFTEEIMTLQPTSVTLSGTVNPDAISDTTSQFEYGTSTTYGSTVTAVQAPGGPEPGSADDGSGSTDVPVTANLTGLEANTTYHYRLDAEDENGTNNGKDKTFTTPPGPPLLGSPASEVTPFTATLTDMVNPEHPPTGTTTYYFEYGPTSAYGQRFPLEGEAGDGSTAIPATQAITGLTPGTIYHYALVATNSAGATATPDQTFTTLSAAAPAVSTGAASAVTQYEATLSGALDPQGLQTSYHFDIGADTNYGTQVFGPTVISPSTVTLPLQNLQPGTTYHYRLTATNSAGTTYGADETFTTAAIAPVITQPLTPPLLATPNIAFPTAPKTTTPKVLTNAQKLAKALKACAKKPKSKRAACRKQVRSKYGAAKKKKKV